MKSARASLETTRADEEQQHYKSGEKASHASRAQMKRIVLSDEKARDVCVQFLSEHSLSG
jgi:hypothetical protein